MEGEFRSSLPVAALFLLLPLLLLTRAGGASYEAKEEVVGPRIRQVTSALGSPEAEFEPFERRYVKEYEERGEYAHRLGVFASNMASVAAHQILDPTAEHGITPFSDLTEEKFEARFIGLVPRERKGYWHGAAAASTRPRRRWTWWGSPRASIRGLREPLRTLRRRVCGDGAGHLAQPEQWKARILQRLRSF